MAEKKAAAAMKSIECLREEQRVTDAVFEGVKAANGWKAGRQVEENIFKKAVAEFLNGRVDGIRKDKGVKR